MSIDAYQDVQSIGNTVMPITHYLAMVRRIAVHLRPRIPAYIELDDMIQSEGVDAISELHYHHSGERS